MSRPDQPLVTALADGIILSLHIQPRASRNQVCGMQDNQLKLRLTSPPVDGAANRLCREYVAELFDVSKSSVEIISGETSRHKRVRITSGDPQRLCRIVDQLTASP